MMTFSLHSLLTGNCTAIIYCVTQPSIFIYLYVLSFEKYDLVTIFFYFSTGFPGNGRGDLGRSDGCVFRRLRRPAARQSRLRTVLQSQRAQN